jgi:hypothetical protein
VVNIRTDEAFQRYEELYEKGYGWIKDMPELADGLTKVEREVIRILLTNNGEMIAGILLGELLTKFVYVDVEEIKTDVLKMINQRYNLIDREYLEGKPFFTREKISLTSLGNTFEDVGYYYLLSKLPIYFLQDRIVNSENLKMMAVSLDKVTLLEYIKSNLEGRKNSVSNIKLNIPKRSKIQKYNSEWLEDINIHGSYKFNVLGSYKYSKFLNELIVYDLPLGKSLEDILCKVDKLKLDVKEINVEKDEIQLKIGFKREKSKQDIDYILSDLGYIQELEQTYYVTDNLGDVVKASFDYLLSSWFDSITNKSIVLEFIESELKKDIIMTTESAADYISEYDGDLSKCVVLTLDDEIKLVSSVKDISNVKFSFNIFNEDIVLVTDRSHVKVKADRIEKISEELKSSKGEVRILGAFPMSEKSIHEDRIFYFINQKGFVKVTKEKDLYTRSCKVGSTLITTDEKLVKILANDEGKDDGYILFITKKGYVKVLHVSELKPKNRSSKYVLGLRMLEDDEVLNAYLINDEFEYLDIKVSGNNKEVKLSYKDYEIVTTKLHRGKKIKGIESVESFEILNQEIIKDKIFR